MGQLLGAFRHVIPIFLIVIPIVILIEWYLYNRRVKKGEKKKKAIYLSSINVLLLLSIIGVLLVTLLPRHYMDEQFVQLVPFLSMWDVLMNNVHYTVPVRILGFNIILFIPFGFFLALRLQFQLNVLRITLIGMLFSIGIETAQYILPIGRVPNIDDVILNTFGAFIGALLGSLIRKWVLKYI